MQLILNKEGLTLGVREGRFHIRHKEGEQFAPPAQLRSICMHRSTRLTHEAVMLAVEHEIEVLFIDGRGMPIARLWSPRYGSVSTIRKNQVRFSYSPKAVDWVKETLMRKVENQTVLLSMLQVMEPEQDEMLYQARAKIESLLAQISAVQGSSIAEAAPTLRGLEGRCGVLYFRAISESLPEMYRFSGRSQHPATDMFNALLNYAYGILYAVVEAALIKAGMDPYLGIFHRDEYNRPVMVYDFIEPYRVWADYVVVRLCMDRSIFIEFFEINAGSFWLADTGKRILTHAFNDYLEELTELNGLSRSRRTHVELDAQRFATRLKDFE